MREEDLVTERKMVMIRMSQLDIRIKKIIGINCFYSAACPCGDIMVAALKGDRRLTGRELLVHELHVQVEHLLLGFTLQQLQLLPPTHHVAQIPHLHNEGNDKDKEKKHR